MGEVLLMSTHIICFHGEIRTLLCGYPPLPRAMQHFPAMIEIGPVGIVLAYLSCWDHFPFIIFLLSLFVHPHFQTTPLPGRGPTDVDVAPVPAR